MKKGKKMKKEPYFIGIISFYFEAKKEVKREARKLKKEARKKLQDDLAKIGKRRWILSSVRTELVYNVMEDYRQTINGVNKRQEKFNYSLFLALETALYKLLKLKGGEK